MILNWENLNGVSKISDFNIINQNGISEGDSVDLYKQGTKNMMSILNWENLNGVHESVHFSIINQNGIS